MKSWWNALAAAVLLLQWAVAAHAVGVVDVVDDRGITVSLASPPQRIVSLLPSITESVCALGGCGRLVGVDRYSNWPASVQALPQLGGGIDPNVEAVAATKPDVVLLARSSRVIDRLEALGLRVLVLEPKNHGDMRRVLDKLGQVLGTDDAQRVWRDIDASVSAAAQALPESARRLRVYYEVNSGSYAAGESSFMGETLTRLGAKNIIPAAMGPFPKINPEFVVRADPDVIMTSERSAQGMEQRPGWSRIRAVRDGRICRFRADQSDILVRPGPRMGEAARIMAQCLLGNAK